MATQTLIFCTVFHMTVLIYILNNICQFSLCYAWLTKLAIYYLLIISIAIVVKWYLTLIWIPPCWLLFFHVPVDHCFSLAFCYWVLHTHYYLCTHILLHCQMSVVKISSPVLKWSVHYRALSFSLVWSNPKILILPRWFLWLQWRYFLMWQVVQ